MVHADPLAVDLAEALALPSWQHWLGCDSLGRDMLARILWGARLSLGLSISVVLLALITGSFDWWRRRDRERPH
jgi:peptide/nickel transport system permease protein